MNHTARIIKAVRNYLDWTQEELADKSGITSQTIKNIENEHTTPNERTLRKVKKPMEEAGILFTACGFEFHENNIIILDDFINILVDAQNTLKKGDVIFLHCADERRNTPEVTSLIHKLEDSGIKLRFTYEEGNSAISTSPDNYRWIDKDYFANAQVCVIYKDKYIKHICDKNGKDSYIMVKNAALADAEKKQFEYFWRIGKPIA